jgi:hypothetical protein
VFLLSKYGFEFLCQMLSWFYCPGSKSEGVNQELKQKLDNLILPSKPSKSLLEFVKENYYSFENMRNRQKINRCIYRTCCLSN